MGGNCGRGNRIGVSLALAICGVAGPHAFAQSKEEGRTEPGARLMEVRFWSLGDATRIAIQIDGGEFHYKYDRLENPSRLFFDIEGVRPQRGSRRIQTISVGDTFIRQIRIAETQPGTTRIVLDLNRPVDYSASQLTNPSRLMIELRPEEKSSNPVATVTLTPPPKPDVRPDLPLTPSAPAFEATPRVALPPGAPSALNRDRKAAESPVANLDAKSSAPVPVTVRALEHEAALTTGEVRDSTSAAKPRLLGTTAPLPARTRGGADPSMTRVLGLKLGKVVIDPGHGGHDTGTHGPAGFTEKELVLDVGRRLGALIEARLGSEVIFTRSDDTFIPLEERTQIANEHKADLFLSIHANSSPVRNTSGVETYYLNFTTDKAALDVAARENAASQHSIYDLKDLVERIARKDKIDESREFAQRVQTSLSALSARSNSRSRDRGVRTAPFVVLIGASMPSILAEIGFLTNAHDENLMKKPAYRQKIAEAIYKGLAQYAATLSHFQVARTKASEN
jgi:N-acetylmuramoyl-L-alanine amidase